MLSSINFLREALKKSLSRGRAAGAKNNYIFKILL